MSNMATPIPFMIELQVVGMQTTMPNLSVCRNSSLSLQNSTPVLGMSFSLWMPFALDLVHVTAVNVDFFKSLGQHETFL